MGRGVRHTGGKYFGKGARRKKLLEEYTHIRGKEARIKKILGKECTQEDNVV